MINRYWTTFETLAEIERLAGNDNSAWEIDYASTLVCSLNSLICLFIT